MRQSSTSSACALSQQIFMWPSCLKFLQNAKTEGLAKLKFCWVSRLDNKYLNITTELHSCYQNQKQILSAKLDASTFTFCTLSAKCKMCQKKKEMQLITKVTYQEIKWLSEEEMWEACRQAWVCILLRSTAQPPLSIVTSLGCSLLSLSLSRGWQNYLLHQSWGWANASTQRTPFHRASPTVTKETEPIMPEYQWHGHPPFCAPQGLWLSCSAAWSCLLSLLLSCYTDGSV